MILVYLAVTLLLAAARLLVVGRFRSRYARWERHDQHWAALTARPKIASHNDPQFFQHAFDVIQASRDRDHSRRSYEFWEAWSSAVTRASDAVRSWRGRKMPYVAGVLDVVAAKGALDALGLGDYASLQGLTDFAQSVLHG